MKRLLFILLVLEAALVAGFLRGRFAGNAAGVLLVVNSLLLILSARRWRRKPSCCR